MQAATTLGLSLVAGKDIANHLDDLAFVEGRHTGLARRIRVQVQAAFSACALLESVDPGVSLGSLQRLVRPVLLGCEGMLSILRASRFGSDQTWRNRIDAVRVYLPRVVAGALLTAAAASALTDPLAAVGPIAHAGAVVGERLGICSPAVASRAAMASTLAALLLGFGKGSLIIRSVLAVEVAAFVAGRIGAVRSKLGLSLPQPNGQPLAPRELRELQQALPQQRMERLLARTGPSQGALAERGTSIWSLEGRTPSPAMWPALIEPLCRQLEELGREHEEQLQQRQALAPWLASHHRLQACLAISCQELREPASPEILSRQHQSLQRAWADWRQAWSQQGVQALVQMDYPEPLFAEHSGLIDRAFAGHPDSLQSLEQFLLRAQARAFEPFDDQSKSWLFVELAQAANELPPHPNGVVAAVLRAFQQMNDRFSKQNFGPGSLLRPDCAQKGWGRCLESLHRFATSDPSMERRRETLRLMSKLVLESDSCSAATLRAIQDCHDAAVGIDRLKEGFFGSLQTIRAEELASWKRNSYFSLLQNGLSRLGRLGISISQRWIARLGRPTVENALSGAEALPWLSSSYTQVLPLVRRKQLSDWACKTLAAQIALTAIRASTEARLSSPSTLLMSALAYLTSPSGREAWHASLQKPEFRAWLTQQGGVEDLESLVLPDPSSGGHANGEENVGQPAEAPLVNPLRPSRGSPEEALPAPLWRSALLLLAYSGCLDSGSMPQGV
jgi:hypothetical protein